MNDKLRKGTDMITDRMQDGIELAQDFLSTERISFSEVKPSDLPQAPGVYAIFRKDTEETLYVGRTKNIRQRLYKNHLHGQFANARLKKYLVDDPEAPGIQDSEAAKQYLLDNCYFQFIVEPVTMKRGRLEGLLSFLFNVRYMYEEH